MRRREGTTLFELMMVVVAIGVLACIFLPALARAREGARRASCMSNLMQVSMAMRVFAQEHEGELPWSGGEGDGACLNTLFPEYVADLRPFVCPASPEHDLGYARERSLRQYGDPYAFLQDTRLGGDGLRGSYDYFGCYTVKPITLPHPSKGTPRIPVMWDLGGGGAPDRFRSAYHGFYPNHSVGGNVLWLDGSVEFRRNLEWASPDLPIEVSCIEYQEPPESEPEREPRYGMPPEPEQEGPGLMERLMKKARGILGVS